MFARKTSKPQSRIDTLIGAGTRIEGNVTFAGGLRVDGEIKGNVCAPPEQPSTLIVSEHARVEGEIRVSHLVVNGTLDGPVHATEFIELEAKARVRGDVYYNRLEVQLGAVIEGRLLHRSGETKAVELKLATRTSA